MHEVRFTGIGVAPPVAQPQPLTLTPPPPGGGALSFTSSAAPGTELARRTLHASHSGSFSLQLRCPATAPACRGSVAVRTARPVRLSRHRRRAAIATLASAGFQLQAGQTGTVVLHLSAAALALLERAGTLPLSVATTTLPAAGTPVVVRVAATLHAPPRRHR